MRMTSSPGQMPNVRHPACGCANFQSSSLTTTFNDLGGTQSVGTLAQPIVAPSQAFWTWMVVFQDRTRLWTHLALESLQRPITTLRRYWSLARYHRILSKFAGDYGKRP
ncbi:hypothetical protein C8R42DRAFT_716846 [Lentinula raphanica]|nr:hypothetical protein C8R42DRAFT_716846 [Lentinula raphanica]